MIVIRSGGKGGGMEVEGGGSCQEIIWSTRGFKLSKDKILGVDCDENVIFKLRYSLIDTNNISVSYTSLYKIKFT